MIIAISPTGFNFTHLHALEIKARTPLINVAGHFGLLGASVLRLQFTSKTFEAFSLDWPSLGLHGAMVRIAEGTEGNNLNNYNINIIGMQQRLGNDSWQSILKSLDDSLTNKQTVEWKGERVSDRVWGAGGRQGQHLFLQAFWVAGVDSRLVDADGEFDSILLGMRRRQPDCSLAQVVVVHLHDVNHVTCRTTPGECRWKWYRSSWSCKQNHNDRHSLNHHGTVPSTSEPGPRFTNGLT